MSFELFTYICWNNLLESIKKFRVTLFSRYSKKQTVLIEYHLKNENVFQNIVSIVYWTLLIIVLIMIINFYKYLLLITELFFINLFSIIYRKTFHTEVSKKWYEYISNSFVVTQLLLLGIYIVKYRLNRFRNPYYLYVLNWWDFL